MKATIHPSSLQGEVIAPSSKSYMQRAALAALLRGSTTTISASALSADDEVMLRFLSDAGCGIIKAATSVAIDASEAHRQRIRTFDFGDSGLAARMCIPLLALGEREVEVTGSPQLRQRPMHLFEKILPQLGVHITTQNGQLPVSIKGPLMPQAITVDSSVSSQFITGLLMAYSAANARDVTITCNNLVSSPYIDITIEILRDFGLKAPLVKAPGVFYFDNSAPASRRENFSYIIPGDWSGAAFLAAAGAISGDVSVTGLDAFSSQGDKAVLQALMDAGTSLSITADGIRARRAALKAFHFDATDTPDLFPPLAVLALFARGTSVIEGISRLRNKETDRAVTICEELQKAGASIQLQDDLMIIDGGKPLSGAGFSSRGDHRIAMMCAVAAVGAASPSTIDGAEAVEKSYPHFWQDMQSLGAAITIE